MSNVKQSLVMRRDLNMRRGKECSQAAHAAMSFMLARIKHADPHWTVAEKAWMDGLFTKICLQVSSEKELMDVHEAAVRQGLESHLIIDSGKTEFGGVPTPTCCAIGPAEADAIDAVTRHLKLY